MSRIGKQPIAIPTGVDLRVEGSRVSVRGPKGSLERDLHPDMSVSVEGGTARVTVAVDSPETIDAAARAGVREVLVDVDVGLPRCGCDPGDAGRLADLARSRGLEPKLYEYCCSLTWTGDEGEAWSEVKVSA